MLIFAALFLVAAMLIGYALDALYGRYGINPMWAAIPLSFYISGLVATALGLLGWLSRAASGEQARQKGRRKAATPMSGKMLAWPQYSTRVAVRPRSFR